MINGENFLRKQYEYLDLDEEQFQPNGLDLTLGEVYQFDYDDKKMNGLYKNKKVKPALKPINSTTLLIDSEIRDVYCLNPHSIYMGETAEQVEIGGKNVQLYFPRSTLLRCGIDVRTAVGDAGFIGRLSFLLENKTDEPFYIEKGSRFAQLIDFQADGVLKKYNGDYQEVKE